jgi:hypothetical protein
MFHHPRIFELNATLRDKPGKMLKGPIVGPLGIRRETAGGEFPAGEVVLQTVAAYSLSRTGFVAAIAVFFVLFLLTFHKYCSSAYSRFGVHKTSNLERIIHNSGRTGFPENPYI